MNSENTYKLSKSEMLGVAIIYFPGIFTGLLVFLVSLFIPIDYTPSTLEYITASVCFVGLYLVLRKTLNLIFNLNREPARLK